MKYIDVAWHHEIKSEPVRLVSEIDNQSNEVRKIEFFRDGRIGFASKTNQPAILFLAITHSHPFLTLTQTASLKPKRLVNKTLSNTGKNMP